MLLRRRLCRRCLYLLLLACAALCACALLLGDPRAPALGQLTDLHRCPACYGVSVCPALYSNQITEDPHGLRRLFNAKNIFYGSTKSGKRVVLKKLGHDWELRAMDKKLCSMINKPEGCQPNELLNITNIEQRIAELVRFDVSSPQSVARSGLLLCPYTHSLPALLHGAGVGTHASVGRAVLLNTLAVLLVNPEPIMLQLLSSGGWPVPAWGGACGRLAVAAHAGRPLAQSLNDAWPLRLHYARQILDAAMDFTFKHDRFRFYLLDWSLDNIAVDEHRRVRFVDLEDVVVLDKQTTPDARLPEWYGRHGRDRAAAGFTFSLGDMCRHHLSDHNVWAACYVLSPLLRPVPSRVGRAHAQLDVLLEECLHGANRFATVAQLQRVVADVLADVGEVR